MTESQWGNVLNVGLAMTSHSALTVVLDAAELADSVVSYGIGPIRLIGRVLDPTPGFLARREKMLDEWWVELVNSVNEHARKLDAVEREQVRARLVEDEAIGILAGYVRETCEETDRERRRMLRHAAAALTNFKLRLPELARVRRVLRELEPDDLIVLYGLWLARGRSERAQAGANAQAVLRLELWHALGAESLETAGCVRVEAKGGGLGVGTYEELRVTRTGLLILRALRSYIAARQPALSQTPGHETTPEFRSEREARAMVASVPGLYGALLSARGAGFGPVQYSSINVAGGAPHNGKTKLIFETGADVAEQLRAVTTREAVEHGQPVSGIFVDAVSPSVADGMVSIQIAGPHDVLRWLAYDVDAWWT